MERGRPAIPVEEHKMRGTYRKDRHGEVAIKLPSVVDHASILEKPPELGPDGLDLWKRAWGSNARKWLSPESDYGAVYRACKLCDDLAHIRQEAREGFDLRAWRVLVEIDKQFGEALRDLGFTPLSRAKLGVAEVETQSKLEELMANRAKTR